VRNTQPVHYTQRALSQSVSAQHSPARARLEKFGVALITIFALGLPLLFGLAFYLAVNEDGISINQGNPLTETRLWMTREKRGITGIALQTSGPAQPQAPSPNTQCAITHVFILRWVDGLKTDQSANYCACYSQVESGKWQAQSGTCR
jgi:hypothetical protein